jgi:sugar lactone lactonase YvrE
MSDGVELVLETTARVGEGPIWDSEANVLYWVDIMSSELHIFDPASGNDRVLDIGQYVTTVVPYKPGSVMVTVHHGFGRVDLETGELTIVADPESHIPTNRFNDGKCDPAGRFWAGTMSLEEDKMQGAGSVYRMDTDGSVHKMIENISISNGIAWSLDHKTMYYIDSLAAEVTAYDYDIDTGKISNKRTACTVPDGQGLPDGMTIDAEGKLWVAHWGGSQVTRWDPDTGQQISSIKTPVAQPAACAFGGPDLDVLYITTARESLSEDDLKSQPLAGSIFKADPGVKGIESYAYGG